MLSTAAMSKTRSVLALPLAAARKRAGMTQRDVARMLRVSRGAVGNWEAGTAEPDWATIVRLADLYRVTTDYLMGRTDDMAPPRQHVSGDEATAAHANPPPAGWDPADWERKARERLEAFLAELRREWENEQRRRL